MPDAGEQLRAVLEGYAKFLLDKRLALPKHQPYLVRWVREFLAFAADHAGYTFEQTPDLYLAEVGRRVGVKPWQVQQAADVKAFLTRLAMVKKVSASSKLRAGLARPRIARC